MFKTDVRWIRATNFVVPRLEESIVSDTATAAALTPAIELAAQSAKPLISLSEERPCRTSSALSEIEFQAPNGARAYVIDDHSAVRKSLHLLLGTVGIMSWPFVNAGDFLDQLDTLTPAPILLDVKMPDLDGIEVMRQLNRRHCAWPVIIMTAHSDVTVVANSMKLGAIEFLEKPFELDAAVIALHQAYDLLAEASQAECTAMEARNRFGALTRREAEVVAQLMSGAPNKIAAANMGLSIRTVEMYRATALSKLGTKNIVEAVALARSIEWNGQKAIIH